MDGQSFLRLLQTACSCPAIHNLALGVDEDDRRQLDDAVGFGNPVTGVEEDVEVDGVPFQVTLRLFPLTQDVDCQKLDSFVDKGLFEFGVVWELASTRGDTIPPRRPAP